MMSTQKRGYSLAIIGGSWFGVVVFVVRSNFILRESPLGAIARALDKLPAPLQSVLFLVCWAIFFLGWVVPIAYSVRLLRRAEKQENGPSNAQLKES
jgi:hypothetical protein